MEEERELVVTAGRTGEEAAAVPGMVTVITAQDIAASGATAVTQVLEQVAGIRFTGSMTGAGGESISMRGFGANSSGRVLILVDGVRLNNPDMSSINWNIISLSDIERIEVLDGSASVQYGNSAVGGVVNIITKRSGRNRTEVALAIGSFFTNEERFSFQRGMEWGNFSISGGHSGSEGYQKHSASGTANGAIQGTFFLSENLSLGARTSFVNMDFAMPGSLSKAEFEADASQVGLGSGYGEDYWRDEGHAFQTINSLSLLWSPLDILEIEAPVSYTWRDSSSVAYGGGSASGIFTHSVDFRPRVTARLSFGGMNLRILGGIDLWYTNVDRTSYSDNNYKAHLKPDPATSLAVTQVTLGPYLTARFDPLAFLTLNAGLRYDTAFYEVENDSGAGNTDKSSSDMGTFVYDAGVVYHPLELFRVYGKFATLFRYPFTDELVETMSGFHVNDLKPETGFNLEGGVGLRLSRLVDLDANVFFMQLTDEIAYDSTARHNFNMDKTRRIGTNVSLGITVPWVSLRAEYSFVNAVYSAGVNDGKSIPQVPGHTFYGEVLALLPWGISLGPDFRFRGESYFGGDDANAQDTMPSCFLLGAKLRWVLDREGKRLSVQLNARNLLDTVYAAAGYYSSSSFSYYVDANMGRSFTVSVQYQL